MSYLGGGELALLRILPTLASWSHTVDLAIVAPTGGTLEPAARAEGARVHVLPIGRGRDIASTVRSVRALARLAREYDVMHANDVRAAAWCQLASLLAHRPWVWHVRDLVSGTNVYEQLARWLRPDGIVAISGAVKRRLLAFRPWSASRVVVVHHGLDATAYAASSDRATWRTEMHLAPGAIAIGIVGRLVPWKGQEDFLHAAARLVGAHPSARFFVVGDVVTDKQTAQTLGDYRRSLEELARELGLADRVTFTGQRADSASVMAGLDVLVLASHAEPFGLVLLEAMSVGTAIVATAAGAAEEVLADGAGMLVPPRDPVALASAIEALLVDAGRRRALGEAGRRRVLAHFPLDREAGGVQGVWQRVRGRSRPGGTAADSRVGDGSQP